MAGSGEATRILVAGDIVDTQHLYETAWSGQGLVGARAAECVEEPGGAEGLRKLLLAAVRQPDRSLGYEVDAAETPRPTGSVRRTRRLVGAWAPTPTATGSKERVWRARLRHEAVLKGGDEPGIGDDRGHDRPPDAEAVKTRAPAVVAIDDANLGFRNHAKPRSWFSEGAPRWIVLRTVAPLARNDLWQDLIWGDRAGRSADGQLREDLICVVSADDLRQEQQSSISRGLSWERTLSDLHAVLSQDPILVSLARCRYLVVCFSADAALVIARSPDGRRTATLVFDPVGIEGDWSSEREGEVPGQLTCMAAAVTLWAAADAAAEGAASDPLARYVEAGLHAVRDLVHAGHGAVTPGLTPDGFPFERLAELLTTTETTKHGSQGAPAATLAHVVLPWPDTGRFAPGWSLLLSSQTPPEQEEPPSVLGLARLLVTHGPDLALAGQPRAVFGNLTALDWREIESLRGIRRLMSRFEADPKPDRPLCIGIFGPPGAGKSFGVKEIAKKILGERGWITCNLSQIEDAADLAGPFHQARDLVLSGITPVVFLDEFDANELRWLQHLIAPMQDGVFQDGHRSHAVGKVVLVFAGGTSPSFRLFSEGRSVDTDKTFKARKGPDFVSRLDATLDVMGPNPREDNEDDRTFPLRRAQLLRHFLAPSSTATLDIDADLLTALLLAPRYRHGSRSLEKLAKALRGRPGEPIRCSALPPPEILDLSVDRAAFEAILGRNAAFRAADAVTRQARHIHEAYLARAASEIAKAGEGERRDAERNWAVSPEIQCAFDDLPASVQEDNAAAARRTIDVLALIGMGVTKRGRERLERVVGAEEFKAQVEHHMERLAEAEHDGWMAHRRAHGWVRGPTRDYTLKTHDCLKPYQELSEHYKARDRMMVLGFRDRIVRAGFHVVWL